MEFWLLKSLEMSTVLFFPRLPRNAFHPGPCGEILDPDLRALPVKRGSVRLQQSSGAHGHGAAPHSEYEYLTFGRCCLSPFRTVPLPSGQNCSAVASIPTPLSDRRFPRRGEYFTACRCRVVVITGIGTVFAVTLRDSLHEERKHRHFDMREASVVKRNLKLSGCSGHREK